jgi:EAL domain-containing protein (putative c-di-GMP-specific phosphodiesterase class I)
VEELTGSPEEATSTAPVPHLGLGGTGALVFQPAVDLDNGRLLGFEALLRWHDSSGRDIPPTTLIPWAESQGQMNKLNEWILLEACSQAAHWPPDMQLAVNCSMTQLHKGIAAMAAASALERSGLNPDRLTVEVTEDSVADRDAAADLQVMTRLGVQITVDDVGPGWSVPDTTGGAVVNTVKIHGSLIAGLTQSDENRAVVEEIVSRCRANGICTVAEAVESAEQVVILRELRVETAQGYFFSPPLTATEAADLAAMDPPARFALSAPSLP